jgi:hypothetical protein
MLIVLIGASGSGKTAIAEIVKSRYAGEFEVFHFDRIGVPPIERMIDEYGSGEAWQRAKTMEWMTKLAEVVWRGSRVLFEGQTRLSFLAEGAARTGGVRYAPILADCDDQTRILRLSVNRGQPELADANMMNWARWLRRDAFERGCEVLDTSALSLEECAAQVVHRLRD